MSKYHSNDQVARYITSLLLDNDFPATYIVSNVVVRNVEMLTEPQARPSILFR